MGLCPGSLFTQFSGSALAINDEMSLWSVSIESSAGEGVKNPLREASGKDLGQGPLEGGCALQGWVGTWTMGHGGPGHTRRLRAEEPRPRYWAI